MRLVIMYYVYSRNIKTAIEYCIGSFETAKEAVAKIAKSYAFDGYMNTQGSYYYYMVKGVNKV